MEEADRGEAFGFEVGEQPLDIAFHPTRDVVAVGENLATFAQFVFLVFAVLTQLG